MQSYLLFFITLTLLHKRSDETVITLPDTHNRTLDYYLCNSTIKSGTVLSLQFNITHFIRPFYMTDEMGSVCLTSNVSNITIQSDNPQHGSLVKCVGDYSLTRRGFVFYNVSQLTVSSINFTGCGGILTNPLVQFLNESSVKMTEYFYFGGCQPAALVFYHCAGLVLTSVHVKQHLGFGLILMDSPGNITFSFVSAQTTAYFNMSAEEVPEYCLPSFLSGSGMLILYNPKNYSMDDGVSVNFKHILIENCYTNNYNGGLLFVLHDLINGDYYNQPWPIVGAAGLTIIIAEREGSKVEVNFEHLHLENNTGMQAGNMFILYIDVLQSSVHTRSSIIRSGSRCVIDNSTHWNQLGQSLTIYFVFIELNKENSLYAHPFTSELGSYGGQSFCANSFGNFTQVVVKQMGQNIVNYEIVFNITTFVGIISNPNRGVGMGLYVASLEGSPPYRSLNVVLQATQASNFQCLVENSIWLCNNMGVLAFVKAGVSIIDGNFTRNQGISVIFAQNSNIYLHGEIVISNNQAETFGAIQVLGGSALYFVEPMNLKLAYNRALFGAGIYAIDNFSPDCVIQYLPQHYYDSTNYTSMNINLTSKSNFAELAGSTIYGDPIYHCILTSFNISNDVTLNDLFISSFGTASNDVHEISSVANSVCFCDPKIFPPNCTSYSIDRTVHPGQIVEVHITALDIGFETSVYALVTAQFRNTHKSLSISLPTLQWIDQIQPDTCSSLNYTILHESTQMPYPVSDVLLVLAPYTRTPRSHINLTLVACPKGFYPVNKTCSCLKMFNELGLQCEIQNGSVYRPPKAWIGITHFEGDDVSIYGYSSQCPSAYCFSEVTSVNLSDPFTICFGSRKGTLCGQCHAGMSVVFGSAKCQNCSNAYLATILLYAVAGVVLVILLFALQLTVRFGTINGLIFYANILGLGFTNGYLLDNQPSSSFLAIFIALINLELGFPLCFYDGMDELVSRCLQFVFPIYIWSIVIVIIYLSRYSSKLAKMTGPHSVAVLITLVHLSYSKILATICNTLTFSSVKTEDDIYTVWFFAGHMEFGKGLHVIPLVLSLAMLFLFILPYTLITTLAPFLNRYRFVGRYMPLTDAIFAPFKHKWRFWFGARLCLLVVMFSIQALSRGSDVVLNIGIQFVLVNAFLVLQALIKPFKNFAVECLDLFFMLNFCLIAFVAVFTQKQESTLSITSVVLISSAFLVFMGILLYHSYLVHKDKWKKVCQRERAPFQNHSINYGTMRNPTHTEIPDPSKFDEYREPLLEILDD